MFSIVYHSSFVDAICSTLIYVPAPVLTVIICVSLCAIRGLQDLKLSAAWVVLPLEFPFVVLA